MNNPLNVTSLFISLSMIRAIGTDQKGNHRSVYGCVLPVKNNVFQNHRGCLVSIWELILKLAVELGRSP